MLQIATPDFHKTLIQKFLHFTAISALLVCSACVEEGVTVKCGDGSKVRLEVIGPEIIRVQAVPEGRIPQRHSLAVIPQKRCSEFKVERSDSAVAVSTSALKAVVRIADGSLWLYKADGTLLAGDGHTAFTPIEVEGKKAWSTTVSFDSPADEAFYGLGQHQAGEFNHKGGNEELYQYNTKISVPLVVSSKGYGILFDAYSYSRWGNPSPYLQLGQVFNIYDKEGVEGALTGTYMPAGAPEVVRREDSLYFENEWAIRNLPKIKLSGAKVLYEGFIEALETGDYHFTQYYAGFQETQIGGKTVMAERWRPAWNPNSCKYVVHLEAGEKVPVKVQWDPDGDVSYIGLRVAPLYEGQDRLTFSSEFEPSLDCYFIAGDTYDNIIHGYRTLTGKAPVMPKWAMGFWQSRERYSTQEEVVNTLREFRSRHIPVDNIVQDWQYWLDDQWGSHEFDPARYPDPEAMMDSVHAMHGRLMISVWPKFYTNTDHYKELKAAGCAYTHAEDSALVDWLGHPQSFYDAYSPKGRAIFWRQMDETLYTRYGRKIDAWWMDASEPNLRDCLPMDYFKWLISPTALGPSTEYLNAYALVNAQAIYEGQRGIEPDRRVFLLTRNGFAGLQRYSTASWSGDIGTSWTDMRAQMAAGLGYSMSGIPFWSMDVGGFSVLGKFYSPENLKEWQELQARWHQWGAFVPLFRAHGQWPQRELWNIAEEGSETYESILYYMRLRYRLMPYIYSLVAQVYRNDYTIMRGLPMDFPQDANAADISDQWMFGPAFMPCPVYEYGAREREVYFPEGVWYDFYTGEEISPRGPMGLGRDDNIVISSEVEKSPVPAPYGRMPLFVRGGSIVPIGPEIEWTDQKWDDDILLLVYAGADADFTLYSDDGVSYGYERGESAIIPIHWADATRTLTIGKREGSWPGMPEGCTFRVQVIDPEHPFDYDPDAPGNVSVEYEGNETTLTI